MRDSINHPRVFRIAFSYYTARLLAQIQHGFWPVSAFRQWQADPNTSSASTGRSDPTLSGYLRQELDRCLRFSDCAIELDVCPLDLP
jgi:hypothetical protein